MAVEDLGAKAIMVGYLLQYGKKQVRSTFPSGWNEKRFLKLRGYQERMYRKAPSMHCIIACEEMDKKN